MKLIASIHAYRRVLALAEVCQRYSAVITGLSEALGDALLELEGEPRDRAVAALRDAGAQIASITEHLDRALEDLPEGATDR